MIDFISFLFNFVDFIVFYGLIGCMYFWKVLKKYYKVLLKSYLKKFNTLFWVLVKKSLNRYSCSASTEKVNIGAIRKSFLLKKLWFCLWFPKLAHERSFSHLSRILIHVWAIIIIVTSVLRWGKKHLFELQMSEVRGYRSLKQQWSCTMILIHYQLWIYWMHEKSQKPYLRPSSSWLKNEDS